MSRIDLFKSTHVYHICLNFNSKRFADERDKKKFLDLVLQRQREERLQIFAFAILDDELQLAAGLPRRKGKTAAVPAKLLRCLEECCPRPGKDKGVPEMNLAEAEPVWEIRRVRDMEELLHVCMDIHMLPRKRGYAKLAGDYWWSSLRTYRGTYLWANVNVEPLLRYLGEDMETGRRRFIRMHQDVDQRLPKEGPDGEEPDGEAPDFLRDSEIFPKSVTKEGNDDRISLPENLDEKETDLQIENENGEEIV